IRNGPDTCSLVPSPRRGRDSCPVPPCARMKRPLLTRGPSEENARSAVVHSGQDKVNRECDQSRRSLPLAKEAEQELEHVDEVQVQAQRAEDDRLAGELAPAQVEVLLLQALRVIGGQAGEDQHAEEADGPEQAARLQPDVEQA